MIDHKDMVRVLAKNPAEILNDMTEENAHLLHMAVGISGEVAELAQPIYEHVRLHKVFDTENFIEEMGDIEFYLEGLCQGLNVSLPDVTTVTPSTLTPNPFDTTMHLSIVAGEILDLVKKAAIYTKSLDRATLKVKIGTFNHSLNRLCMMYGVSRHECIEANIKKLGDRYKGFEYSNEAAQKRADKTVVVDGIEFEV